MAQQVTISTFLDLKDNLSPGLAKVEAALQRMTQMAAKMQQSLNGATNTLRPMANNFHNVNRHMKATIAHANALAAAMRNIKPPPPLPPLPAPRPPPGGGGGGGGAGGGIGFFGATGANILAYGVVRAAGMAKTAVLGFYNSVIEKGMEYEQALAATSSAMFTMGISPSMRVAEAYSKQLYEIVRDLSAKLPGEAKEYVEVFQRTMPQAIMSGATDMRKYADLVAKYSAVAIQRGVSAKVAASNLQIMLKGSAREQTVMASNLATYTGKSVTELNKLSRAARFELYAAAIEKAAGGMDAMANKAETIFGTLRSDIDYIFQIGASPLFEAAKQNAIIIHEFFEKNKTTIMETVSVISTGMGNFLTGAVTLLRDMVSLSEKVASSLGFLSPKTGEVTPTSLLKTFFTRGPMGLIQERGRVELESRKELERTGETGEMARRIGLAKTYGMLEDKYGMTVKSLEDIDALTKESKALLQKGMFETVKKPKELALSEFLEFKGAKPETIQAVHEALMASGVLKAPIAEPTKTPEGRTSNYQDFRYSRFDINQAFAEGFDPDRIAVAFATDLAKMGEQKTQSMNTQTYMPH